MIMDNPLDVAARMLKLRVQVIGAGAFRRQGVPETGEFQADCVLPGGGEIVRLFEKNGLPMAQMHYADGKPMSAELRLLDHRQFISLMHNVDMNIWRCADAPSLGAIGSMLGVAAPNVAALALPAEVRDLVDLAVTSEDGRILDLVEMLYAQGAVLEMPDLWAPWRMPVEGRILADACSCYGGPDLQEAASVVIAVAERQYAAWPPGTLPDTHGCLIQADASIQRWQGLLASSPGAAPVPGRR